MNVYNQLIQKLLVYTIIPIFIFQFLTQSAFAQVCRIESDSIILGEDVTERSFYYYDAQDLLVKKATIDSGQVSVSSYDTLFYAGSRLDSVHSYSFWNGTASVYEKTEFGYNGNGQINSIFSSGDNGNGSWTQGYDLFYNVAGQLTDLKLNPFTISGDPEGFNGNFENLSWANGNLVAADLIADMGGGLDTLELSLSYDDKPNVQRYFYIQEGPDILFYSNVNNVLQVIFDNNENMGPAGSVGVDRSYTYHPDGEVATVIEAPALFESRSRTTQYNFSESCTAATSIFGEDISIDVEVYPNPVINHMTIRLKEISKPAFLRIFDMQGRLWLTHKLKSSTEQVDLSNLPPDIYLLEIRKDGKTYRDKLFKH